MDREPRAESIGELIGRFRYEVGAFAVVALIALIVFLFGGGSERTKTTQATSSTTAPVTLGTPTPSDADALAGVSPIDCIPLITPTEVEQALAIRDRPSNEQNSMKISLNEVCTETLEADPAYFVQIRPGSPSDFEPGATLIGVSGHAVPGVGQQAVWFGGSDAEGGGSTGVLSVRQDTPIGVIHFQIALGRPDVDTADQLEIAKTLALAALPRFPGMPTVTPPAVDLCDLVTDDEAEAILAPYRDVHPAALPELMAGGNFAGTVDLSQSGDATCTKLILTEIYVKITQASDTDLEPGAQIEGVAGEPVSGIGDAAVWFEGVPYTGGFSAPHDEEILSVRRDDARFRIVLALPDMPVADQLGLAERLATTALSRIPGVQPPESLLTKPPQTEPSVGYLDNINTKVESGEWTLEEGILYTLRLFAGEADPSRDPSKGEIADDQASQVIDLAQRYLDTGTDEATKTEIARLLGYLVPTREQLDSETAPTEAFISPDTLLVSRVPIFLQVNNPAYCGLAFGTTDCLIKQTSPDLEAKWPGKYALYRPKGDLKSGWELGDIDWALESMTAAATTFEGLGKMPKVAVLLSQAPWSLVAMKNGTCTVTIGSDFRLEPEGAGFFKQHLAMRMAVCLEQGTFGAGADQAWWSVGLAVYLSDVVYKDVGLESTPFPPLGWDVSNPVVLANYELSNTVLDRGTTNWSLFEYLHSQLGGVKGVLGLVPGLPTSLKPYLHGYYKDLTDGVIHDVGSGTTTYGTIAWRLDITGETSFDATPSPYGLRRIHAVVTSGKVACMNVFVGGDVQASWRQGVPGAKGSWTNTMPDTISGDSVYLFTTTGTEGIVGFAVEKVVDNADDCDKEEPSTTTTTPSDEYQKPDICLNCGDSGFYFTKRDDWSLDDDTED
jgi:hypothetical protein